jgi:ribosomal-protein-alanine N-acetyltransferase
MRYPAAVPIDIKNLSLLWASPELVPEIAALHARLFDPPWDAEGISRLTEHTAAAAFVAQVQHPKTLAGFIIGHIAADEAEILSIGVAPEWQRRGIARHMVEGLVRAARRAEVKRLFLEVAADNARALRLYKGLGFEPIGYRKAYYRRLGSPPVDAVVLSLALDGAEAAALG